MERLLKEAKSKTAKYVAEVKTWLKTTGIYKMQRVPTGSSGMTPDAIKLVEQEAAKFSAYLSKSSKSKTLHNIDPRYVLKAVDNPLPVTITSLHFICCYSTHYMFLCFANVGLVSR